MTEEEFFAVEENGKYCIVRTFYHDKYKQIVVQREIGFNRIMIKYTIYDRANTINEAYSKPISKTTHDEVVKLLDKYHKKYK
jgi:hypothetical protein